MLNMFVPLCVNSAKHFIADRDSPFAPFRVTPRDCSNFKELFHIKAL